MAEQFMLSGNLRADLDPEIWSLAAQAGLGKLRGVYRAAQRNSPLSVLSGMSLGLGICLFLPAIAAFLFSPAHPLWIILPGLFLIVVGVYLLLPRHIYAHWHVYLWEVGFLYEKGPLRQVFRWDQIEHIEGQITYVPQLGGSVFAYKVRRQDGYEVKLTNLFQDGMQLINVILEEFARQVASRELTLVPPRDKTFASFKLDRQGISDKQSAFSWQDIQELTIEQGQMAVLKRKTDQSNYESESNTEDGRRSAR